jgi:hypothetical protein
MIDNYPYDSISHPDFVFSFDDCVFMSEPKLDSLMSIYNIQTGNISYFLTKGNGPDELLDINQIGLYNDSSIFVRSTFSSSAFIYSVRDTSCRLNNIVKLPEHSTSAFFDNSICINSTIGNNRFSIENTTTGAKNVFGDSVSIKGCPQNIVSGILQGLCSGSSENKKFVWASFYGDIIEIYDYSDINNVKLVKRIIGLLPEISINNESPVFLPESKLGIVSISASESYVYALYNENTLASFAEKKDDILLCDKILVYDWKGNPVTILKTDRLIRSISFNSKYNQIFCVGHDSKKENLSLFRINPNE